MSPHANPFIRLSLLLCAITILARCVAADPDTRAFPPEPRTDLQSAMEYCDTTPLHPAEGIWRMQDDHTVLLIARDATHSGGIFKIIVVESPDSKLWRGAVAGTLRASVDPKKFSLTLCSSLRNGMLGAPLDMLATLSDDGSVLKIDKARLKIKINPLSIFPRFWRFLKLSFLNPAAELPTGLVRIYPDQNYHATILEGPIYL